MEIKLNGIDNLVVDWLVDNIEPYNKWTLKKGYQANTWSATVSADLSAPEGERFFWSIRIDDEILAIKFLLRWC